MLRRSHDAGVREFQFTFDKIAHIVGHQMLRAAGDRQFQNMVVVCIRQIGSPAEIDRMPDGRRAKIVQQGFPFRGSHRPAAPERFPVNEFLIFCKERGAHRRLILARKTTIQYVRAGPLLAAEGRDENIGVLHDVHDCENDITGDTSQAGWQLSEVPHLKASSRAWRPSVAKNYILHFSFFILHSDRAPRSDAPYLKIKAAGIRIHRLCSAGRTNSLRCVILEATGTGPAR